MISNTIVPTNHFTNPHIAPPMRFGAPGSRALLACLAASSACFSFSFDISMLLFLIIFISISLQSNIEYASTPRQLTSQIR